MLVDKFVDIPLSINITFFIKKSYLPTSYPWKDSEEREGDDDESECESEDEDILCDGCLVRGVIGRQAITSKSIKSHYPLDHELG